MLYLKALLDILWYYKRDFFYISVLSGIAIFNQLIAIQSFMLISGDGSFGVALFGAEKVFDYVLQYGFILWFLFIVSGVLSGVVIYYIKNITVRIMIDYEVRCVDRLAVLLIENVDLDNIDYGAVSILMTKDCRFGGRMAYEVSNVIFPITTLVLVFPYLVLLNSGLTFVIFALIFIVGGVQLWRSGKSELIAKNMEGHAKHDKIAKQKFFEALKQKEVSDYSFGSIPSPLFMETYRQRLLVPHKGNLLGATQFIAVLAVIAAWFSAFELRGTPEDIFIYSLICLFLFSQARTIPKSLANSIVFFSYFKRVFVLFNSSENNMNTVIVDNAHEVIKFVDDDVGI